LGELRTRRRRWRTGGRHETRIVSAHRTPIDCVSTRVPSAARAEVIIAGQAVPRIAGMCAA